MAGEIPQWARALAMQEDLSSNLDTVGGGGIGQRRVPGAS